MNGKGREKLLFIAAISCLLLLGGERLILRPLLSPWKERNAEIERLQQQLSSSEILLDRRDSIRERWEDMQKRSLPANKGAAENIALNAVGVWARESGLSVTGMKPRWIENDEAGDQLEVRVSASGQLRSVARFLYELETDPLSLKLEDVEITSRSENGSELVIETRFTGVVLAEGESV